MQFNNLAKLITNKFKKDWKVIWTEDDELSVFKANDYNGYIDWRISMDEIQSAPMIMWLRDLMDSLGHPITICPKETDGGGYVTFDNGSEDEGWGDSLVLACMDAVYKTLGGEKMYGYGFAFESSQIDAELKEKEGQLPSEELWGLSKEFEDWYFSHVHESTAFEAALWQYKKWAPLFNCIESNKLAISPIVGGWEIEISEKCSQDDWQERTLAKHDSLIEAIKIAQEALAIPNL